MIDAAAVNAFALLMLKSPSTNNRLRRIKIEEVAINLITPQVKVRLEIARYNKYSGIETNLLNSFKRLNFEIIRDYDEAIVDTAKKRCSDIECRIKKNNTKYKNICSHCDLIYCHNHVEKLSTIICKLCIERA